MALGIVSVLQPFSGRFGSVWPRGGQRRNLQMAGVHFERVETMRRSVWAVLASSMVLSGMLGVPAPGSSDAAVRVRPSPGKIDVTRLSSGAKAWFQGPQSGAVEPRQDARRIAFGSNVDANDPQGDLAA